MCVSRTIDEKCTLRACSAIESTFVPLTIGTTTATTSPANTVAYERFINLSGESRSVPLLSDLLLPLRPWVVKCGGRSLSHHYRLCVGGSPRTRGRRSVAQGESASPGYARTVTRARVLAGDGV